MSILKFARDTRFGDVVEEVLAQCGITQEIQKWFNLKECNCTKKKNG